MTLPYPPRHPNVDTFYKQTPMEVKVKELLQVVFAFIIIFAVVLGMTVGLTALYSPNACAAETAAIGYPSKWDFWGGCQIKIEEGRWIPLQNWRYYEEK